MEILNKRSCKSLKKEGPAYRNVGNKKLYIPDCKINLTSFVKLEMFGLYKIDPWYEETGVSGSQLVE